MYQSIIEGEGRLSIISIQPYSDLFKEQVPKFRIQK